MAESKIKHIEVNGVTYRLDGSLSGVAADLGLTEERLVEIWDRDAYTPVLSAAPTSSTLTYTDTNGSRCDFRVGQLAAYPDSGAGGGWNVAVCKAITGGQAVWSGGLDLAAELAEQEKRLERLELLPESMQLDYPSELSVDNMEQVRIKVSISPSGANQNVLFLGDNQAVTVMPDGLLTVNAVGTSIIHAIPIGNVSLYQSIRIKVVGRTLSLAEDNSLSLTETGDMIIN